MKKLLYITTKTCGPCRQFGPTMEKVAQHGILVEKLNGEIHQSQVIKYGVRSVPTVIKVNAAGEELGRFTGIRSLQEVIDFYNN